MKKLISFLCLLCLTLFFCSAGKYSNFLIDVYIPDELEIKSGTGDEISSLAVGEDWGIVLQRKGISSKGDDTPKEYCRVVVAVQNSGWDDYSNEYYEKEISSYTKQMLAEIYDYLEATVAGNSTIVKRYKRDSERIDGKYALHVSLLEDSGIKSLGNINSEAFYFYVDGYLFFITTSYSDAYAEVVDKVISSVKIKLSEEQKYDGTLYKRTFPWLSSYVFLWPDKNAEWTTIYSETDGTTKKLSFSDIWGLGFVCEVSVLNSPSAISKKEQNEILSEFKNQVSSGLKEKLKEYNVSITKSAISNGVCRIEYNYSQEGMKMYGKYYCYFQDTKRLVSVVSESISSSNVVLNKIIASFGL